MTEAEIQALLNDLIFLSDYDEIDIVENLYEVSDHDTNSETFSDAIRRWPIVIFYTLVNISAINFMVINKYQSTEDKSERIQHPITHGKVLIPE